MYQKPQKLSNKKLIEIICIIIAIVWAILFIINYINYTKSKPLIFAIHSTKQYDDGYVEEYISLGYTYRIYNRIAIAREELVPFWVGRENPEAEPDLPKVEVIKLEDVPSNPQKRDKLRGLLYFYGKKHELVGVYKCVNSNGHCEKAFAGWDKYNLKNKDPFTKLDENLHTIGTIYDKFSFVDDSLDQDITYGNPSYQRIIYLYQFTEGEEHILAKYSDIKESSYNKEDNIASGDYNKFIVRDYDSTKWGVIRIDEDGEIVTELPFEYDSIDYDSDTDFYILCKDNVWFIYDLKSKQKVSVDSVEPIYNVWRNSNLTYYYKTGNERPVTDGTYMVDYKIYRMEGNKPFLELPRVTQVLERDNFVAYITQNDNTLHFVDYGKVERYKVPLYFYEMRHTDLNHPAFTIWKETEKFMTLRVYKGRNLSSDYDTITVNVSNWDANTPIK